MNNELSELISKAVAAALAAQTISNKESINNQSLNCENAKPSTSLKMSTKRKITEYYKSEDKKPRKIDLTSEVVTKEDVLEAEEKIISGKY